MVQMRLSVGYGTPIEIFFDHDVNAWEAMKLADVDSTDVIAWRVGGAFSGTAKLRDLSYKAGDGDVGVLVRLTDSGALDVLRHDAAHILAQAVKDLYPDSKFAIGPTTDDGFFYDFDFANPLSIADLPNIEAAMHRIMNAGYAIERETWTREQALSYFADEPYKIALIESIPIEEEISVYRQGDFVDLCSGPHSPSVVNAKHTKLLGVSGAYWRGNSDNKMLTRITGTTLATAEALGRHLKGLEEAEERDHRKIGKELGLFHTQDEAVGQIFWHPKGYAIYLAIEGRIRDLLKRNGYQEVKTPIMVDSSLWQQSGHLEKFADNMIMCHIDNRDVAIKPMNCPCHVQIFKQGIKSYKELPIRLSEFGSCHRNESSGSMRGLMRVRGFTQDDAHIFCAPEQIMAEIVAFCKMLFEVYSKFGFDDIKIRFSDRPETRAGSDEVWDKAEDALMSALRSLGRSFELNSGEGAFYGPKLEFVLSDALGRDWQCGTVQLDFVLPERLDAHYIGEDNCKHRPVMIHRAILGTFERFIGILIEHYAGKFPFWLAPTQVRIVSVNDESADYARQVEALYSNSGLRVEGDYSNNKLGYKIRAAVAMKIPVTCVIGSNEMKNRTVALRKLGGEDNLVLALDNSLELLLSENHW